MANDGRPQTSKETIRPGPTIVQSTEPPPGRKSAVPDLRSKGMCGQIDEEMATVRPGRPSLEQALSESTYRLAKAPTQVVSPCRGKRSPPPTMNYKYPRRKSQSR